jgi:hypothetical protein
MTDIVLSVTTRECIALRGFTQRIELGMLESLEHETWFAQPALIHAEPLAAEVRLVTLFQQADQVLIDERGHFAADQAVLPEAFAAGSGLAGLKKHVQAKARERSGVVGTCELIGYAFDPVQLPHLFLLAYRCRLAPAVQVAAGAGSWVSVATLEHVIEVAHERWFIPAVKR